MSRCLYIDLFLQLEGTILVSLEFEALYINIDHEVGAHAASYLLNEQQVSN